MKPGNPAIYECKGKRSQGGIHSWRWNTLSHIDCVYCRLVITDQTDVMDVLGFKSHEQMSKAFIERQST